MSNHRWPIKKLGEVCEIYQSQTITSNDILASGSYEVFGANGVIGYYDQYNHESSEIVITCRGATCGSVSRTNPRSWITGNAMVVRPRAETMLKDFLYYELKAISFQDVITGAAQPQITRASLSPIEIPLPPLDEQRRIVSKLDAQMKEVEKMRVAVDAKLEAARALPSSFLRSIFNSPESQTWPVKKLGEVASLVDGDWILAENYQRDGVRLLQVGDVGIGNFIGKSSRYISQIRAKELKCAMLELGDVLISRMPDPIGRACVLPELPYPAITAVDVSIWRPPLEKVDRKFAVYYFTRSDWFDVVSAQASGATRQRVSRKKLEQLTMPVPSIALQRRIVARLDEQMAHANAFIRALESEREAIAALPAALLREVFG